MQQSPCFAETDSRAQVPGLILGPFQVHAHAKVPDRALVCSWEWNCFGEPGVVLQSAVERRAVDRLRPLALSPASFRSLPSPFLFFVFCFFLFFVFFFSFFRPVFTESACLNWNSEEGSVVRGDRGCVCPKSSYRLAMMCFSQAKGPVSIVVLSTTAIFTILACVPSTYSSQLPSEQSAHRCV